MIEHQKVRVAAMPGPDTLSFQEVEELARLNERRGGFCTLGYRSVTFAQWCGIVWLGGRALEILPKTMAGACIGTDAAAHARGVLLSMLEASSGVPFARVGSLGQRETRAPLLEVFIRHFLLEVMAQVKKGLLTRYVEEEGNLTILRGRILLAENLRHNVRRPDRIYCGFDELTQDNGFNQVIRQALSLVRGRISSQALRRLWLDAWNAFAQVSEARFTAEQVARLPRTRLVYRYTEVLQWCEWMLRLLSPAMLEGRHSAPALLFDMNKLFEAHVTRCLDLDLDPGRWRVEAQRQGPYLVQDARGTGHCDLVPDVTVIARGSIQPHTLVDAKWKLVAAGSGVAAKEDIHQMVAYATGFGCSRIKLAYPLREGESWDGKPCVLSVNHGWPEPRSIAIELVWVPLAYRRNAVDWGCPGAGAKVGSQREGSNANSHR